MSDKIWIARDGDGEQNIFVEPPRWEPAEGVGGGQYEC